MREVNEALTQMSQQNLALARAAGFNPRLFVMLSKATNYPDARNLQATYEFALYVASEKANAGQR